MNFPQDSVQKFFSVADTLTEEIRNGIFSYGKPFLSRSEICERFCISLKTAHKVQKELCKRNLISANRGRAFTVCDPDQRGGIPLHEIRLLRQNQPFATDGVMDELSSGIRQMCAEKNIQFSEIYLELQDKNQRKINTAGGNEPGQGIVMMPYRSIMCRGAGYFLKYWQPFRVTVDYPLPCTSGVMMDEADAVKCIFEDARQCGAETIMQIPHTLGAWNQLYSYNSFRYGELYSQIVGIKQLVCEEPEINGMLDMINRLKPDALFFHGDKKIYSVLDKINYQPKLYFFCRSEENGKLFAHIPNARCYISNYTDFGKTAVELLLKADYKYAKRELIYIKGKLV